MRCRDVFDETFVAASFGAVLTNNNVQTRAPGGAEVKSPEKTSLRDVRRRGREGWSWW